MAGESEDEDMGDWTEIEGGDGKIDIHQMPNMNQDEFFSLRNVGKKKWMRWGEIPIGDVRKVLVYFDSYNNVEVYHSSDVPFEEATVIDEQHLLKKANYSIIPVSRKLIYVDRNMPIIKARACLFKLYPTPTPDMLLQMSNALDDDESDVVCRQINGRVIAIPTINDVVVSVVPVKITNNDGVLNFVDSLPRNIDSVWMTWARYGQLFLYKDQENVEVYYPKANQKEATSMLELVTDANVELVEIPRDTFFGKLIAARTCLYKHKKNELYASAEELKMMVDLMKNAGDFQNTPAGVNALYSAMYGQDVKRKKTGWKWKPVPGTLPKEPQFYFNPKPLRSGPESAQTNAYASTLAEIKTK